MFKINRTDSTLCDMMSFFRQVLYKGFKASVNGSVQDFIHPLVRILWDEALGGMRLVWPAWVQLSGYPLGS